MPKLIKSAIATYIPGIAGVGAVPSSPAQDEYWTSEPVVVCTISYTVILGGPSSSIVDGGSLPTSAYHYFPTLTCSTTNKPVYHPAVAGTDGTPSVSPTPEQITVSLNKGWNSYASSVGQLSAGSYIKLTVKPGSEGALLGIGPQDFEGQPIQAFIYGLMVDVAGIHIFESGVKKTTLGTNAPGTEIRIARLLDHRIVYSTSSGDLAISDVQPTSCEGELFVYGLLYAAHDEVSSSEFVSANLIAEASSMMSGTSTLTARTQSSAILSSTGSLIAVPSVTALLSGGSTLSTTATRHQMIEALLSGGSCLQSRGSIGARGYAILPLLESFGGDVAYGIGHSNLPVFTGISTQNAYTPATATRGYANLPFLTAWALGLDMDIGHASVATPSLISLAGDYPYGFGYGELPQMYSVAYGGFIPEDTIMLVSTGVGTMRFDQNRDLVLFLNSQGQIQSTLTLTREQALSMISGMQAQSTLSILGVYGYTLLSNARGLSLQTMNVGSGGAFRPDLPTTGVVWVVNTETQASSQYEDYGFNSFIKRNGVCYGVAADGIYRLDGVTDAGAQVDALAYLGRIDFGTALKKLLPNIYMGVASGAPMKLDVNADGTTYTYEARSSEATTIKNHRVDLGRGLKANTLGLTVKNKSGAEFELATVETLPAPTTRRI